MGVMECRRNGCSNILCELYSVNFGYICYDCFEEGKASRLSISAFMNIPKGTVLYTDNWEGEFKGFKDE